MKLELYFDPLPVPDITNTSHGKYKEVKITT